MFLVLQMLGCGPSCGPWSEIKITGADVDQERVDAVWAGIGTMSGWTGSEKTCLQEIELVEGLRSREEDLPIYGRTGADKMELRAEMEPSEMERVTRHEICHNLDRELGWVSQNADGALQDRAELIGDILYPEQRHKLQEAFADICESGPQIAELHATVYAGCEDLWLPDGQTFVHEQLFAHGLEVATGTFTLSFEETVLPITERTWNLPFGPNLLFVSTPYDDETERMTLVLELYNIKEEQVVDTYTTPSFTLSETYQQQLYSAPFQPLIADDSILLLARGPQPSLRVTADGGQLLLEEEQWPDLGRVHDGRESDGQLVYSTFNSEYHGWTHANGAKQALRFTSPTGESGRLESFRSAKGGALLAWHTSGGDYVQKVDPAGEQLWSWPVPFAEVQAYRVQEGLNGEVLVGLDARYERGLRGISLALDPETGSWRLPTGEGCAAASSWWFLVDDDTLVGAEWNWSADPMTVTLRDVRY